MLMKTKQQRIDKIIKQLDKLKSNYGNTIITMETPQGTVSCKVKEANIYSDPNWNIVIDSE